MALPLLIAMLALAGLWGYVASGLVSDGQDARTQASVTEVVAPNANAVLVLLQEERRLTAAWQADPNDETRGALEAAREQTDKVSAGWREFKGWPEGVPISQGVTDGAALMLGGLNDLPELREAVDDLQSTPVEAYRSYTVAVGHALALISTSGGGGEDDLARGVAAAMTVAWIGEAVSQQEALVAGVPAGEEAEGAVREEFARSLALQRQNRTSVDLEALPSDQAGAYELATGTDHWNLLTSLEAPVGKSTTALPQQVTPWQQAARAIGPDLRTIGSDGITEVTKQTIARGDDMVRTAVVGSVVAAVALVLAILAAIRITRRLLRRLSGLEKVATERTEDQLPHLVERARHEGDPVGDVEDLDYGRDEVGRVATAMQRQWLLVVETIVRQARGREGSETVFIGLARRTQVLINRMIPMLDKLEREQQDSRLLKDIFAVDHLATRVRRHTENLLILGGALPARRWGKPVPVYEVMRSAISETEEYSRVEALPAPSVSLTGRAVADIVHLLAELIENGTSFSPPETKVSVSAEIVARGRVALEIVDRGLGMSEEEYDRLNKLLSDPPKLDVMALGEAPRLGLFVVARLAKRHKLEISLRRSPYGGTLAVVLVPSELLQETKPEPARDAENAAASSSSTTSDKTRDADTSQATTQANGAAPASAAAPVGEPPARPVAAPVGDSGPDVSPWQPPFDYDHSGYPAYGGAGLFPNTPGEPSAPEENGAVLDGRTHPEVDHRMADGPIDVPRSAPVVDETVAEPVLSAPTPEPPSQNKTSPRLPVRVRGESLAEQLRKEQGTLSGQDDDMPSPDRAGAIMAAIQSGNRRARSAKPAPPGGGPEPRAEGSRRDTDAEGSVRKDQR